MALTPGGSLAQPETKFKLKVAPKLQSLKLKTNGGLWFLKTQEKTTRGIPDYLMCAKGNMVAWELKVGKNKASDLQAWTLNNIEKAGGVSRVVTPENFDECYKELECLCGISF